MNQRNTNTYTKLNYFSTVRVYSDGNLIFSTSINLILTSHAAHKMLHFYNNEVLTVITALPLSLLFSTHVIVTCYSVYSVVKITLKIQNKG